MVAKQLVDLDQPIVPQVGSLGEAYLDWVHEPVLSKKTPRFFESNFLEFFTKTAWWVVPLVWMPIATWSFMVSLNRGFSLMDTISAAGFGVFVWSFLEYVFHRHLFHMKTSSYWGNTLHYILHGFHHKNPMDSSRLVFPPCWTALFVFPIWVIVNLSLPPQLALGGFAGGLSGYVVYDLTHYYLHHGKSINFLTRRLKKFHYDHHFKGSGNDSFGVTSAFWDWIFQTLPPKNISY